MHTHEYQQFSDEQRERASALIESMAWGDLDGSITDMEAALRLAMEATRGDFQRWEQHAESFGFADEFSLTPESVAELSPEWRLAYVARLLRTIALSYGVNTEFGLPASSLLGFADSEETLAALLRGLNDIAFIGQRQAWRVRRAAGFEGPSRGGEGSSPDSA
jgi:hypothetical protein